MASTGQPETGRGMDSNSKQVEITEHVEAWTYKLCGTDDAAGAVTAVTKGQALVQRTTDNGNDLSGYVFPSTGESRGNFVGFADEDVSLIGADVNLQGYLVSVVKHGFCNYVKANGALINGDRVMTSGPSGTYLADAAGHYGTVAKFPETMEEDHITTIAEAAAGYITLQLVPDSLIAVSVPAGGAGHIYKAIYPPSETLIADTVKMHAAETTRLDFAGVEMLAAGHVLVHYKPSSRYVIGTVEKPCADNARTQINLINRGV